MVIQIRLGARRDHTPEEIATDSLNRSWSGYDSGVSDEALWECNRGRWNLSEDRIAQESYVTFVHDGHTVAAYRIDDYERVFDPSTKGSKVALVGRPLDPTSPLYRNLVNRPAKHKGRNAINYLSDDSIYSDSVEDAGRRAFLLTWNPDNWDWSNYAQSVAATERDEVVEEPWSTGSRKTGIRLGDLVFLLRQGKHGRGIVGSGQATDFSGMAQSDSELIHKDSHWNGSGALANFVDVSWGRLLHADSLLRNEELEVEFPEQNWSPMGSGTQIQPGIVEQLLARWNRHIKNVQMETVDGQGYAVDAALRKVIEDEAQEWLMQHFRSDGWSVTDTRYSGPYDAYATKEGQILYLEAKGTRGAGNAVFVTRGEVEHARKHRGQCVIGIWAKMQITGRGEVDPDAGEKIIMPFEPEAGELSALQYRWEWPVAGVRVREQ